VRNVTKPGIRRLARRAGVVRVQGLMYNEMRGLIKVHIENIVKLAVIFMQYKERRTLMHSDVKEALRRLKLPVWGVDGTEKTERSGVKKGKGKRTAKRGSVAVREIKKYQKSSNLLLARAPIERVVRQSMYDFTSNTRIEGKALALIHASTEARVTKAFSKSQLMAIHAGRKGVTMSNLRAGNRVRNND